MSDRKLAYPGAVWKNIPSDCCTHRRGTDAELSFLISPFAVLLFIYDNHLLLSSNRPVCQPILAEDQSLRLLYCYLKLASGCLAVHLRFLPRFQAPMQSF